MTYEDLSTASLKRLFFFFKDKPEKLKIIKEILKSRGVIK